MRPILASFSMLLRQIAKDGMLIAVSLASVLAAIVFKVAIPQVERMLCTYFAVSFVLAPYYRLFDVLLILLAPYMLCFAAAMVMLDEHEQNLARYLSVTPLKTGGYLISRLGITAVLAAVFSCALSLASQLTTWNLCTLAATSVLSAFCGFSVALFLFAFSRNKVEGMAMGKLSGLLMLGLPIPFFLHSPWQYMFSLLPSYWLARYALEGSILWFMASLALSGAGIVVLYRKVLGKIL